MKCYICGKEVEESEVIKFTNGEHVCKNHVEEFAKNIKEITVSNTEQLKQMIVKKSIERIFQVMKNKVSEIRNYVDISNMDELNKIAFNMLHKTNDYNQIILQTKKELDPFDEVKFEQIDYNSPYFQYYFEQKMIEMNEEVLDKEEFGIVYRNLLQFLPKTKQDVDFIFDDNLINFQMKIMPIIMIIRYIWRFFPNVCVERVINSITKWGDCVYFKERLQKDKEKYESMINILKKQGFMKENQLMNENWMLKYMQENLDGNC